MKISGLIKPRKKSGFTIIEVMIVLAIAGLIMVVVFYAIPQVQAARRDTQRKAFAGLVHEALLEYWKNNRKIPSCTGGASGPGCASGSPEQASASSGALNFMNNYFPEGSDPSSGRPYSVPATANLHNVVKHLPSPGSCPTIAIYYTNVVHAAGNLEGVCIPPRPGLVVIAPSHRCGDGSGVITRINPTEIDKFSVVMRLERGWYCQDNS